MASYKDKKEGLPRGLVRQKNGMSVSVKAQVWNMQKGKPASMSFGVYPNRVMAENAKKVITDLLGPTLATSKQVRPWQIKEAVNLYRLEIGIPPLRKTSPK